MLSNDDFCDILGLNDPKLDPSAVHPENPTNFTFLDLEMNQPSGNIIQVGAVTGDVITGVVLEQLRLYVQVNEPLDPEISQLTRITQAQLDEKGIPLIDAYKQVAAQHRRHNTWNSPVTWGGDDANYLLDRVFGQLGVGLTGANTKERLMSELGVPWVFGRRSLDIKQVYQIWGLANGHKMQGGLARCMTRLGMNFRGTKHDALDDSINTFRLTCALMGRLRGGLEVAKTLSP